eukprot:TRINITY_DN2634_c0_g1_i8.p2 TRINITY_DN2634_c0_g1~~TRINITY_DN2634_c0_g1_i8.p2  ORF type:complete len:173 (-),score=45.98 TRINITY_DN2634_c0_g1_i8:180-698(-)
MFTTIVGSLIFGVIIDKYNRYSAFCSASIHLIAFAASIIQLVSFVILVYVPDRNYRWVVYLAFVLYGISNAIYLTSYWPCIKFTVPSRLTTTAYGLNFCLQASLMVLGPLLTGYVIDKTKKYSEGYYGASLVFVVIAVCSTVVGAIVMISDYNRDRILYDKIPQLEGLELDA